MPTVADYINLSAEYWQAEQLEKAIECCQKALEIEPTSVQSLSNIGAIYWGMGQSDVGMKFLEQAVAIDPKNISVLQNIATLLQDDGNLESALEYYNRALDVAPKNAYLNWCKGIVLLGMGNYTDGWRLYESGLGYSEIRGETPQFVTGQWKGQFCNHLVIWHEQGFGDMLQFIRYAKLAKKSVNKVYVLAPKQLHRLLRSCPWIDDVSESYREGDFNNHISVMSLPALFKTNLTNVPCGNEQYLFAERELSNKYANIMKGDNPRVGLVWAGNPRKQKLKFRRIDQRRSFGFDTFKPLLDLDGIDFYSLQKGESENDCNETKVINLMTDVTDFAETAAIINNLDLVITVDTSIAHLAGAMMKPTFVLSRKDACWRWLQNKPQNPWYENSVVFGQKEIGKWDDVINDIKDKLSRLKVVVN